MSDTEDVAAGPGARNEARINGRQYHSLLRLAQTSGRITVMADTVYDAADRVCEAVYNLIDDDATQRPEDITIDMQRIDVALYDMRIARGRITRVMRRNNCLVQRRSFTTRLDALVRVNVLATTVREAARRILAATAGGSYPVAERRELVVTIQALTHRISCATRESRRARSIATATEADGIRCSAFLM